MSEGDTTRAVKAYWFYPHFEYNLFIFGEEFEPLDYPEDIPLIRKSREDGYLFGEWFSEACVRGELGSNHITRCYQITQEAFRKAQAAEWIYFPTNYDFILEK